MRIILLLLFVNMASAKVLNYETTRTKSTAGTGVASLLMNEATITNPAPLAFFNMASLYFEKFKSTHTKIGDDNGFDSDNFAIIASDSSKNLKGSVSYVKSKDGLNKHKQLNFAFASPTGPKSSLGFAYRNIRKEYTFQNKLIVEDYKQFIPGVFHAISPQFSLGFVAIDPLRKNPRESKVIMGLQYQVANYITLMLDAGADYKENLSDSSLVRAASQIRILTDFYLRFGAYEDKALKEKGSGFGAGWIQPRLVIDFALRNINTSEDPLLHQEAEDIKESSFSLAYRF